MTTLPAVSNTVEAQRTYQKAADFDRSNKREQCVKAISDGTGFNTSKKEEPADKKSQEKRRFRSFDRQKANETLARAWNCHIVMKNIECLQILSVANGFTLQDKNSIKKSIPTNYCHRHDVGVPEVMSNLNLLAQECYSIAQASLDAHTAFTDVPVLKSTSSEARSEELESFIFKALTSSSDSPSATSSAPTTISVSSCDTSDSDTSYSSLGFDKFSGRGQVLMSASAQPFRRGSSAGSLPDIGKFVTDLIASSQVDESAFQVILSNIHRYSVDDLKKLCHALVNTSSEDAAKRLQTEMSASSKDLTECIEIIEAGID